MKAEGRVWKFDHNVNTDVITAGKYLFLPMAELATHTLEVLNPAFAKEVKRGDILLAGRNFGCGSSRAHAPQVLKHLGVACVVAESFARIFHRNAIAIGLPVMSVPGLWAATADGATLSVDLANGAVVDRGSGASYQGRALPPKMLEVLSQGGILPALRQIAAGQT
jgi:3-isopropylmalate/(R)-2-methylmalate dehydratase small subunit